MSHRGGPIRVLIVDDSLFMRLGVRKLLQTQPEFVVVGEASDGDDAVDKVLALRPDVCTMDLNMPRRDGLSALREIMRRCPTPVVMFSAHTEGGMSETLECLAAGAVDFLAKPAGEISPALSSLAPLLCDKLRAAAYASGPASSRTPTAPTRARPASVPDRRVVLGSAPGLHPPLRSTARLAVVALSTGGPQLLSALLPTLRQRTKALLVVQHMPAGFTKALAERLDGLGALRVREAQTGDMPQAGLVLIAPGDFHMSFASDGSVVVAPGPEVHGVRPAADVTMHSAAKIYRHRAMGLVLTGMGEDGVSGLGAIRAAGGSTYAQDRDSCTVYGMPRAAVAAGVVDRVVRLAELPELLADE